MSAALPPRRVVMRVDASTGIGTGHVMRCLTLARALARRGSDVRMLSRALPGNLTGRVRGEGFEVTELPGDGPLSWEADAEACRAVTAAADWIVVDHYGLDARWERRATPAGARVFAIDDLADRPHRARLLLDPTPGRRAEDYERLAGPGCRTLLGPAHALLRPEFAEARPAALARRAGAETLRHLVVTLGGSDPDNVTGRVIEALALVALPEECRVSVVVGASSPWRDEIAAAAARGSAGIEVRTDVRDMAGLLAGADLVVGAGGTSSWERACLGCPTLVLVLADNQRENARRLVAAGAAVAAGGTAPGEIADALGTLVGDAGLRRRLSAAAARLCDGLGTRRAVDAMAEEELDIRPATIEDCDIFLEWRNAVERQDFYRSRRAPAPEEHRRWFSAALGNPDRILEVAEAFARPVAFLRLDLDRERPGVAVVSIAVAPAARGRGYGRALLARRLPRLAREGVHTVEAEVHAENAASLRLFEAAGFRAGPLSGPFRTFTWTPD